MSAEEQEKKPETANENQESQIETQKDTSAAVWNQSEFKDVPNETANKELKPLSSEHLSKLQGQSATVSLSDDGKNVAQNKDGKNGVSDSKDGSNKSADSKDQNNRLKDPQDKNATSDPKDSPNKSADSKDPNNRLKDPQDKNATSDPKVLNLQKALQLVDPSTELKHTIHVLDTFQKENLTGAPKDAKARNLLETVGIGTEIQALTKTDDKAGASKTEKDGAIPTESGKPKDESFAAKPPEKPEQKAKDAQSKAETSEESKAPSKAADSKAENKSHKVELDKDGNLSKVQLLQDKSTWTKVKDDLFVKDGTNPPKYGAFELKKDGTLVQDEFNAKGQRISNTIHLTDGSSVKNDAKGTELRTASGDKIRWEDRGKGEQSLSVNGQEYKSTDGGKTFIDSKGERIKAELKENGTFKREFIDREPKSSELLSLSGEKFKLNEKGAVTEATVKGINYKFDENQRVTESTNNGITTKFNYEGKSQVPKSLEVNGQKFEVNRSEKGISIVGKAADSDKLPKVNEDLHPAFKSAALVLKDEQGRTQSIQRSNGEKIEFGYAESGNKLTSIRTSKDGKTEELKTQDGIKWEGRDSSGNPKTWEGIKSVDEHGKLTEAKIVKGEDGRSRIESQITNPAGKVETRSVDLDVKLKEIKEITSGSLRGPNGGDKVDKFVASLKDLSGPEIQLLNKAYNPENPNALKQDLQEKIKELPSKEKSYQWAEIQGHLSRTGQAGELDAIKLVSDAAKANDRYFNGSQDSIAQTTRQTLLGQTEQQRINTDEALKRLYGPDHGLSTFYDSGPGKTIAKADEFTKAVTDLASKKGAELRTPEEQSNLAKLALQGPNAIENFRQATAPDAFSKEAREHFAKSGGLELIENGARRTDGTRTAFTSLQKQELKDLARDGKESPETQFAKGVGLLTSNAEEALKDAVTRVANDPEKRGKYLNGEELAKSGKEAKTPEEKAALDYYKNWQELFKSAHYTYKDRKVDRFDSLIKNGADGSFANGEIFKQGGNWFQNRGELFNSIEKATDKQLNPFFDGATTNGDKIESGALTDALKAIKDNVNRIANSEDLQKLLAEKVKYGLEIGNSVDKLINSPTLDPKAVSELKAKLPAFKDLPDEKFASILEGYRLQKGIKEGKQKESELSTEQKKSLAEFAALGKDSNKDELLLKGFLQGREVQNKLDAILTDKSLSAGQRDAESNKFLKELNAESRASLDAFRQVRNEAVQSNVRRTVEQAIKDSEGRADLKFQALKDASPAELQRLANDKEYRAKILEQFRNPETGQISKSAEYLLNLQSQGKPLTQSEKFTVDLLQKAETSSGRLDTAEALKALQTRLNEDKDGTFAKELAANDKAIKILDQSSGGYLGGLIKSSTERGYVTAAEWKEAQSTFSKAKDLFTGGRDLATDSLLGANPKYLKHLSGEQGKQEREQLLSSLAPEKRAFFEQIIKQGEVKPEDKLRAFHLGLIKQEEAINPFKELDAEQRAKGIQDYHTKYGSNAKQDLLEKVNHSDRAQIDLLFTENRLDANQALLRSRDQVADSANTFLGRIAQRYDASASEKVNELAKDIKDNGGELSQEKLDEHLKQLAEKLKNFEELKEQTADQIIETAVTIAAGAATPFTGGASLSLLTLSARVGSLALRGGAFATFSKAALTGDYDPSKLAGDFVKYSALTAGNVLGAEGLVALSRLGGRVASSTLGKTFEDAGLAALKSPQVEEALKKGLGKLIEEGATTGGVKDLAVKNLVKSIEGLSPSAQDALAAGIIKNLSPAIREVASDSLKGILINTGRAGRTAALDGAGAYVGDVGGELVRQAVEKGHLDISAALENGVKTFVLAGGIRSGIEAFKAGRGIVKGTDGETLARPKSERSEPATREKAPELSKDKVNIAERETVPREWPDRLKADKPLPPVPEGHVRLYRGVHDTKGLAKEFSPNATPKERQRWWDLTKDLSGRPGDFEKLPAAIQKELKELLPKINSPDIKFYTDDIKTAQKYAGKDGHVLYVDIPKADQFKYRKENHGLAAAGSAGETFQIPATIHTEKAGRLPREKDSTLGTSRNAEANPKEIEAAPVRQYDRQNPPRLVKENEFSQVEKVPAQDKPPRVSKETIEKPIAQRNFYQFRGQDGQTFDVVRPLAAGDEVKLGRKHGINARAEDGVSGDHAVLRRTEKGELFIQDLDSKNGITIQRKDGSVEKYGRHQPEGEFKGAWLREGDQVWLGNHYLAIDHSLASKGLKELNLGVFGKVSEQNPIKIGKDNYPSLTDSQHAIVGKDSRGVYIIDTSKNGTFVRNQGSNEFKQLPGEQKYYLKQGDEIEFKNANGHKSTLDTKSRGKEIDGIFVESFNGPQKLTFPDGRIAERGEKGWRESVPPGHPDAEKVRRFNESNGYYKITSDGRIERHGPSHVETFGLRDGLPEVVNTRPSDHVFKIEGARNKELIEAYKRSYLDLPESVRDLLAKNKQELVIGKRLSDIEPNLREAKLPKGASLDQLEGVYSNNRVYLAEQYKIKGQQVHVDVTDAPGTLKHEVGHSLNKVLADSPNGRFSESEAFRRAYERDLQEHFNKLSRTEQAKLEYLIQADKGNIGQTLDNLLNRVKAGSEAGRSEAFAELFATIHGGGALKSQERDILRAFPNTKRLIEEKLASLERNTKSYTDAAPLYSAQKFEGAPNPRPNELNPEHWYEHNRKTYETPNGYKIAALTDEVRNYGTAERPRWQELYARKIEIPGLDKPVILKSPIGQSWAYNSTSILAIDGQNAIQRELQRKYGQQLSQLDQAAYNKAWQSELQKLDPSIQRAIDQLDRASKSPVKIHVTVDGPADLGRVQQVLLKELEKPGSRLNELVKVYKTHDPVHGVSLHDGVGALPAPHGQNAKGFTLYPDNPALAKQIADEVDRVLLEHGLGLKKPIATGNVDQIHGAGNRVGILKDKFDAIVSRGVTAAKLENNLLAAIYKEFKVPPSGRLADQQLRFIEKDLNLAPNTLNYYDGVLGLQTKSKSSNIQGKNDQGITQIYLDESSAGKGVGSEANRKSPHEPYLTDRPAYFRLAKRFGIVPGF